MILEAQGWRPIGVTAGLVRLPALPSSPLGINFKSVRIESKPGNRVGVQGHRFKLRLVVTHGFVGA